MSLLRKLAVPAIGLALACCGSESVDGEYKVKVTETRYDLNRDVVLEQDDYAIVDVITLGSESEVRIDFIKPHDYGRDKSTGKIGDSWEEIFMLWQLQWDSTGKVADGKLEMDMSYDAYDVTNGEFSGGSMFRLDGEKRYK